MSKSWVTVTTTLPQSLGLQGHPEIQTERLVMKPLSQADLVPFHRLRRQPEFMKYTASGHPDKNVRETQEKLDSLISAPTNPNAFPFYTYFGIFIKSMGELIGDGGVHALASPACGWPEVSCKFGSEHCGRGYGTEFLRAFTAWWWALPRYQEDGVDGQRPVSVRIRVHPYSVVWDRDYRVYEEGIPIDADRNAIEQLYAWVAPDNYASQGMVIKAGFMKFTTWEHPIKKIPVLGWRQSRHRCSIYPSKL
ncbi:acetyltransferase domain-containing protein [Xylaria digitata]|nr:acetyltransferase domain-containing protein [Xylaria digitata]